MHHIAWRLLEMMAQLVPSHVYDAICLHHLPEMILCILHADFPPGFEYVRRAPIGGWLLDLISTVLVKRWNLDTFQYRHIDLD